MRRLIIVMAILFAGCDQTVTIDFGDWGVTPSVFNQDYDYPDYAVERPTVNLEEIYREENWLGRMGEGSCVHATITMMFRWQGRFDLADFWRANHGDGEYSTALAAKLDSAGVRYAMTDREDDIAFLEWACATRRGCGVAVHNRAHMVLLVYMDEENVAILDNNFIGSFKWMPRATFLADWKSSGSWGIVPIMGSLPPPLPFD